VRTLQRPNCGAVYYSSAHPDMLRDPNCICGAKVELAKFEPDHDEIIDRWRYGDLMREFRGERDGNRPESVSGLGE
jgi:hypothetical protein